MNEFRPWMLPLIVAAIVVPLTAGMALAGPPVGFALGFVAAATIALVAIRQRPRRAIETVRAADARRRLLVVLSSELEDASVVERIRLAAEDETGEPPAEVRILVPAQGARLDRWATDIEPARVEAQRKLVLGVAALATAEVVAEAAVGDEDLVQAVEDQLRTYAASEVILVTGPPEEDRRGARAGAELERRLTQPLTTIVAGAGRDAAGHGGG